MRDFITCLEFLTRVRFSKRTDWRDEDFSRSVPYFPLVGLVIGSLLAAVNYSLFYIETPLFFTGNAFAAGRDHYYRRVDVRWFYGYC